MNGNIAAPDVLKRLLDKYERDPESVAETLAVDVTEQAMSLLSRRGLSRTSLAKRMGVSKARVSRIFNAPPNLTLLSIAQLAVALEVRPVIALDGGTANRAHRGRDREDLRTDAALVASSIEASFGTANATSTDMEARAHETAA